MASATILQNRAVIALEGGDARQFLQGLITNDVANLTPGQAIYAALLTPQGKILFDFIIAEQASILFLDCAAAVVADLLRRLSFYRLRADVRLAHRPDLAVAAVWRAAWSPPGDEILHFQDPRLPDLGMRLIGAPGRLGQVVAGIPSGDYDAFRLQLGVPEGTDLPPDQVFALDAGMAELHGVSFSKGCYIGQEVTARMKHRSTARRRFYIVEADQVPPPGTPIEAQGRELGRISSARDSVGLALVRLDRLAEATANKTPLLAAGAPVSVRPPNWLGA